MALDNYNQPDPYNCKVAIIGLGYVGLPLALAVSSFNKSPEGKRVINRKSIGFDINQARIDELNQGLDKTGEISKECLINTKDIVFTSNIKLLEDADVFLVTVPTPIDDYNKPDLSLLKKASKLVGEAMRERKKNKNKQSMPIVIFESTVYPGATEEICIPIIEEFSGLKIDSSNKVTSYKYFGCGYSPERINPGDKQRSLLDITKVTSGSTSESAKWIDLFYKTFITAGTYPAKSIKVAEAAKVIENTQRDLNIALVNELSLIFNLMNIDTNDVLDTASTKWNFLPFRPGLVGGHCIGVDPYYLTYKASEYGYHAQTVLAGRSTNERMASHIAESLIISMCKEKINISSSHIMIMGVTFKENCSDIRNSKVFDIAKRLKQFNASVSIYDPHALGEEVKREYGYNLVDTISPINFDSIIIAVAHEEFKKISKDYWIDLVKKGKIIYDVKGILPRHKSILRL